MNGRGYGGRPHCKARLEGADSVSGTYSLNVITVTVTLRRRRMRCPHCSFSTAARYDTRPRPSV